MAILTAFTPKYGRKKRWRATALQNAGALAESNRRRKASWSTPALWRFGQETEFNAKAQRSNDARDKNSLRLRVLASLR